MKQETPTSHRHEEEKPNWMGKRPDQGRIIIGKQYPGEGYAIIKCGNTELQIGATLLSSINFENDSDHAYFRDVGIANGGLNHIICEAMQGRTGDQEIEPQFKDRRRDTIEEWHDHHHEVQY